MSTVLSHASWKLAATWWEDKISPTVLGTIAQAEDNFNRTCLSVGLLQVASCPLAQFLDMFEQVRDHVRDRTLQETVVNILKCCSRQKRAQEVNCMAVISDALADAVDAKCDFISTSRVTHIAASNLEELGDKDVLQARLMQLLGCLNTLGKSVATIATEFDAFVMDEFELEFTTQYVSPLRNILLPFYQEMLIHVLPTLKTLMDVLLKHVPPRWEFEIANKDLVPVAAKYNTEVSKNHVGLVGKVTGAVEVLFNHMTFLSKVGSNQENDTAMRIRAELNRIEKRHITFMPELI
jgi:hypothetical protein